MIKRAPSRRSITRVATAVALVFALQAWPASAQIQLTCVSGECIDGRGIAESADGINLYDGQWRNGVPHGRGRSVTERSIYEGTFRNGVPHGQGTLTPAEARFSWTGDFVEGRTSGRGTYRDDDGNVVGQDVAAWSTEDHVINQKMHQGSRPPPTDPAILAEAEKTLKRAIEHANGDGQDLDGALEMLARLERLTEQLHTSLDRYTFDRSLPRLRLAFAKIAGVQGRHLIAAELAERASLGLYGKDRLHADFLRGVAVASHGFDASLNAQNAGDRSGLQEATRLMKESLSILDGVSHEDAQSTREHITYELARTVAVHGHLIGEDAIDNSDEVALAEAAALMSESMCILDDVADNVAEPFRDGINYDLGRYIAAQGHVRAQLAIESRDLPAMREAVSVMKDALTILNQIENDAAEPTRREIRHRINEFESLLR